MSACPYRIGDRVVMRYGHAVVTRVYMHENTVPPSWTLGVVADIGQFWLCAQEEIQAWNKPPVCPGCGRRYADCRCGSRSSA